ncbi:hypothetical protein BVX97_00665, partial [bacterium E08(2017)]
AKVGDNQLTAGAAKMLIEFRIASIINQIPLDRVDTVKSSMLKSEVEKFIEKTVLLHEADRLKIEVSEKEKVAALAEVAEHLPPGLTLDQAMDQSPWGRENLMNEMIVSIKTKKLLEQATKDVNVSDEEIDEFYKENKQMLDKPERVDISHILLPKENKAKMEKVRAMLVDGADFSDMAKIHSTCGSGKVGGMLGTVTRESAVAPELIEAAFTQKEGEIGPIIDSQQGLHIVKVTAKKPAEAIDKDKLKSIVLNQKQSMVVKEYVSGLREKADISYPVSL